MESPYRLTTINNPYNPFDEYDKWYAFDISHMYNTDGAIARCLTTSDELPEDIQRQDWENALDTVLKWDVFGIYRKVTREDMKHWTPINLEDYLNNKYNSN